MDDVGSDSALQAGMIPGEFMSKLVQNCPFQYR